MINTSYMSQFGMLNPTTGLGLNSSIIGAQPGSRRQQLRRKRLMQLRRQRNRRLRQKAKQGSGFGIQLGTQGGKAGGLGISIGSKGLSLNI